MKTILTLFVLLFSSSVVAYEFTLTCVSDNNFLTVFKIDKTNLSMVRLSSKNLNNFKIDLDSNVQKLNSDYKAKRYNNITMSELEITIARKDLFYNWLSKKNKLGGQNKIPRLSNDRKYLDSMLEYISLFQ